MTDVISGVLLYAFASKLVPSPINICQIEL